MTYTKRYGTEITDYWPDDSDTEKYIESGSYSISELMNIAKNKWPHATLDNIHITSEKIHTDCIYYDGYDAGDYTDFIVLTCVKNEDTL